MRARWQLVLLGILNLIPASYVLACRAPGQPSDLAKMKTDAILLVQVTRVEEHADQHIRWSGAASLRGVVWGAAGAKEYVLAGSAPGMCWGLSMPKRDRYLVLYLSKSADGTQNYRAVPFWFARMSMDMRLAKLDELMPLGAARSLTVDEERLIGRVEPRVRPPIGGADLSKYTRIYARSSPASLRVAILPSSKPQRLIVDDVEEWPTEASCRCKFTQQTIDIQDLRSAGMPSDFDP